MTKTSLQQNQSYAFDFKVLREKNLSQFMGKLTKYAMIVLFPMEPIWVVSQEGV